MTHANVNVFVHARRHAASSGSHRVNSRSGAANDHAIVESCATLLIAPNCRATSVSDVNDYMRSPIAASGRLFHVNEPAHAWHAVSLTLMLMVLLRSLILAGLLLLSAHPTRAFASQTGASFQVGLRIVRSTPQVPVAQSAHAAVTNATAIVQPAQPPPLPTVTMRWRHADESDHAPVQSLRADAQDSGTNG